MEYELLESVETLSNSSVKQLFKTLKKIHERNDRLKEEAQKYKEKWLKSVDLSAAMHLENKRLRSENIKLSRTVIDKIYTNTEMIQNLKDYDELVVKIKKVKESNKVLLDKFSYEEKIDELKDEIISFKLKNQDLRLDNNELRLLCNEQRKKIRELDNHAPFQFTAPKN